jgi:hypothetical protein
MRWSVPYNVQDAAGNKAETVWRDVVVEEVKLADVESKIRSEMTKETDTKIKQAVERALEEERRKRGRHSDAPAKNCPACSKCECSRDGQDADQKVSSSTCEAYCAPQQELQAVLQKSFVYRASLWFEQLLPSSVIPAVLLLLTLLLLTFLWSFFLSLLRAWTYRPDYTLDEPTERAMRDSVMYMNRPEDFASPLNRQPTDAFFSPRTPVQPMYASPNGMNGYQGHAGEESVFSSSSVISPTQRADSARRRTPYSYNS